MPLQHDLLRRFDYLSTVSGGGYFGGFLGAAFSRIGQSAEAVENELANNHSWSVKWLRENGRFLSPNGVLVVEVGHNRDAAEAAFPRLPFVWLETQGVEDCVFLLRREDLVAGR